VDRLEDGLRPRMVERATVGRPVIGATTLFFMKRRDGEMIRLLKCASAHDKVFRG